MTTMATQSSQEKVDDHVQIFTTKVGGTPNKLALGDERKAMSNESKQAHSGAKNIAMERFDSNNCISLGSLVKIRCEKHDETSDDEIGLVTQIVNNEFAMITSTTYTTRDSNKNKIALTRAVDISQLRVASFLACSVYNL